MAEYVHQELDFARPCDASKTLVTLISFLLSDSNAHAIGISSPQELQALSTLKGQTM